MKGYKLEGKIALITGAALGIGLGTARRFAEEGCRLFVNDIDKDELPNAVEQLKELTDDVYPLPADISNREQVKGMFAKVMEKYNALDILVNNAGLLTDRIWFSSIDEEFLDRVLRINLKGNFYMCKQASEIMIRQRAGKIVNVSSVGGIRSFRGSMPYVTSKGAINAMTRSLALDLAPYGVYVNAVAPGMVATDFLWKDTPREEVRRRQMVAPLRRQGYPEDIASVIAFLSSPDSDYITGQVIVVDGGVTTQCYPYSFEAPIMIAHPPDTNMDD